MKTAAIVQARMGSSRLPGKVLKQVAGKTLLEHLIRRLSFSNCLDGVIIATSTRNSDRRIVDLAKHLAVPVYQGSEQDVLDRYKQVADRFGVSTVVRITADCPLIDPAICDMLIRAYRKGHFDMVHTGPSFAEGADCEVFSTKALHTAWHLARRPSEREHCTLYIHRHTDRFAHFTAENETDDSRYRFTVDEPEDLQVVQSIIENTTDHQPYCTYRDIIRFLTNNPSIHALNADIIRNQGLQISMEEEKTVNGLRRQITIGSRTIAPGEPCYIIAEAGSNHNRDIDMGFRLIAAAAEAGADAVKFQTFSADTITIRSRNRYSAIDFAGARSLHELYKGIELPREWHRQLYDYCRERDICFLSTPFDLPAVDQLDAVGITAFKIASFELGHFELLRHVAATGKPILLSTGLANLGEIEEAVAVLSKAGAREVALLHCGISYPLPFEDVNLRSMLTLQTAFQCPTGYSDHTSGLTVPVAATAIGANLIEKHFTLSRDLPGPDHGFSLEPAELRQMVIAIRDTESALGSPVKMATEKERPHRQKARRSLFAAVSIDPGTVMTADMLATVRPGYGLHPRYAPLIIGKKTVRGLRKDAPVTWDCFLTA